MGDFSKEAIILHISIRRGRLFEGGDKSIDGYYSRKTVRSLRDLIVLVLWLTSDLVL